MCDGSPPGADTRLTTALSISEVGDTTSKSDIQVGEETDHHATFESTPTQGLLEFLIITMSFYGLCTFYTFFVLA